MPVTTQWGRHGHEIFGRETAGEALGPATVPEEKARFYPPPPFQRIPGNRMRERGSL